mgnify:FL=1
MKTKIHCKVVRNVFTNNDGTFSIYGCVPAKNDLDKIHLNKYGNFTLKGNLSLLEVGEDYTVEVEEKTGSYGYEYWLIGFPEIEDFDVSDVKEITDEQEAEMLKSFMTLSQAKYVHEAYPNFIRLVLMGEQDKIDYKNIHNVAEIRLKGYINKVNERFKYYKLHLDNPQYELSISDCGTLCSTYSTIQESNLALATKPYEVLIDVLGRSFQEADRMICEHDNKWEDSEQRCLYLTCYLLECNEEDGNTRINGSQIANVTNQYNPQLNKHIVELVEKSGKIYYDKQTKDLSLMKTYISECNIAQTIKQKTKKPQVWNIDVEKYRVNDNITLTDEQMGILELVCKYDFAMLIGSAGSGKSSSVKALISLLEDNNKSYTLLAPSGIAAKRLRETTGREANTIHRKLASGSTIDSDVVVIDEVSMVDVNLFSMLLNQIDDSAKIILVFDSAQLASIQCGNLVQDMMDSHVVPCAELTKVFRYGIGGIATVGADARNGREYLTSDGELNCENAENIKDYEFIEVDDDPLEQVMSAYAKLRDSYDVKDILVLTPYNKGNFGTYAINQAIQEKYNPTDPVDDVVSRKLPPSLGVPMKTLNYHIGDKVINKKNNYHALTDEGFEHYLQEQKLRLKIDESKVKFGANDESVLELEDTLRAMEEQKPSEATIYNGDIGFIKHVDDKGNVWVQFDEDMIVYRKADLENLLLAYACTSHSSQGCEAKGVIFLTHPSQKRMLSRNLCYMSLTRAKEHLIEIGDISTINNALRVNETRLRYTWLKELLEEEVNVKR